MTVVDPSAAAEGSGAFGGFIGPQTLLAEVKSTAPYLFDERAMPMAERPRPTRLSDLADAPDGWLAILRHASMLTAQENPSHEAFTDYFSLCLAAHFATVMTFVPTDVDTKIRRHFWIQQPSNEEFDRRVAVALTIEKWNVDGVSRRFVDCPGIGRVSGHDGERLSVWCGALAGAAMRRAQRSTELLADAIEREVDREERAIFSLAKAAGKEVELLRLAAVLAHNAGDIDQGFTTAEGRIDLGDYADRFGKLTHERFERRRGAFLLAVSLYKTGIAAEGHRNYPLRAVKPLRKRPDYLLPLGPFLDSWGESLVRAPGLTTDEKAEIVDGLVAGCRRTPGQDGYYRALAGMSAALPGGLESGDFQKRLSSAVRRDLKSADLRRKLAIRRESFESAYAKKARAVVADFFSKSH